MSCFERLEFKEIKKFPIIEISLLVILSIASSCLILGSLSISSLYIDEWTAPVSLEAVFGSIVILLHPYFLFFCPISPLSVIAIAILIKNLTTNKFLIKGFCSPHIFNKVLIIISTLFLISNLLTFGIFSNFNISQDIQILMLILLFSGYVLYFSVLSIFFLDKISGKLKKIALLNKLNNLTNKYLNNLFMQLVPILTVILGYWLCYVIFNLSEELTIYYISPLIYLLIFYIALAKSCKLNELIYFLYRKIIYVLLLYAYGIYYINTSNSPASSTLTAEAVKFAMIIITVVLLLRIPLYKLHQRSKKAYREVEQNM